MTKAFFAYIIQVLKGSISPRGITKGRTVTMDRCGSFTYKIRLDSNADVLELNRAATHFKGKVYLVNGNKRLNAKSFLCVHLARIAWSEIYLECSEDGSLEFRKFIVR